jgi:DNA polymerase-3 subunit delta'
VSFKNFLGNEPAVRHLREALASSRLPHALVLAGPRGAGKYTLALMLAQAANCLDPLLKDGLPDFCGVCRNCTRIAAASDLEARVAEAVTAREELRDTDKKETRVLIQTHPDVLIVPPDPPQLLIKLGQVRTVIRGAYRMPSDAKRAFSIFTASAFMKEAANSLLKVLEEPPEHATLILLTTNIQELLPTIRSRASVVRLGALPVESIEALLAARRPEWKQRPLIARLAQGAVGHALGFNLDAYLASRVDALIILRSALREPDHTTLFKMTETYRAGADGQEKTTALIRAMLALLEDLLLIQSARPALIRNIDLAAELASLAEEVSFEWIEASARSLAQVEAGMRRNLLRSLSLDSFATGLARA